MTPVFTNPLPKTAYLRLLEYQGRTKLNSYQPDLPLIFFISFSRVAAGLSLVFPFLPGSLLWSGISFGCMILATLASIAHLSVPHRFITMIINNRSFLVWEIRLAGALTAFLGLQFLSGLGWFHAYRFYFPWINLGLSFLFLISTGWAYRFETHPAWRTFLLPLYYLSSALIIGLGLRSIQVPAREIPFFLAVLLLFKGSLVILYRNRLKITSPTFLKKIVGGTEKWVFLAFLWTDLMLPGLLTFCLLVGTDFTVIRCLLVTSCLVGLLLERVLFFWVERPVFFLSFMRKSELSAKYPYWTRG